MWPIASMLGAPCLRDRRLRGPGVRQVDQARLADQLQQLGAAVALAFEWS